MVYIWGVDDLGNPYTLTTSPAFTGVFDLIDSILGLLSTFPLNILVIGLFAGVGFKVISKAKGSVK